MNTGNPEKAHRYLGLLDSALCNGQWHEIQELARKVDKHAPTRKCLTLTARSEAQIASASHRPESASSTPASIHGLSELVPRLTDAIEAEGHTDDAYQARVCLAYIFFLQSDHAAALKALPHNLAEATVNLQKSSLPGWMQVCMARGAYIKSSTLEATLQTEQAGTTFQAAALLLQTLNGSNSSEFRAWAERLLGRACLFSRRYTDPPTIQGLSSALRIFTAWGDYWQQTPSRGLQDNAAQSRLDVPRRQVWKLYYGLLSKILQLGLLHAPTTRQDSEFLLLPSKDVSDEQFVASRLHQRAQLKRVEATYESLLMQETQFPKASQWNEEVEFYVEDVIGNWKVLCGSDWSDEELGEGGKDALGRGVLDTLYRAATKTFHSTTILRQLFTVHASLGEFDLAMHAFDSYTEIVGKGKARAEKTGGHEIGFDNDDVALLTAAEAIRLLCRYGDRDQCEKAVEIGKNIQKWLSQVRPSSSKSTAGPEPAQGQSTESNMSSVALAAAYRAVGISRATWARLTYEEERRSEHQAEGLKAMQKAASLDQEDLDSAYALALLLADMRDVPAAIQVLKRALAPQRQSNGDESSTDFSRERRKIPLWHLLALCLTARDDFDNAVKMCEAAFEQFPDPTTLFGQSADPTAGRSRPSRGVVDQMEGFEKENIIQLKITQMTFEELMEGPSIAVDQSDELLSLYARLFGNADTPAPTLKPPGTAATGQTATTKQGGTLRSIAGSIVGRPTTSRRSVEKNAFQPPSEQRTSIGTHPPAADSQAMGAPITIQVTNEEGKTSEKPHHHHHLHMPFKVRGHQGDWREAGNLKSTKSTENLNEKAALEGAEQAPPPPPKDTAVFDHQPTSQSQAVDGAVAHSPSNPDQPIPPIPHNRPHTEQPAPAGHEGQPPVQDTRLPAPHPAASTAPEPRFPSAQNRRQKVSLLVNIWLFVGGLYLRADMFDDAKGAFDEAYKLVEGFELEVAKEDSSARGFFFKGWGGGKGVDELWADVWAERGNLAVARDLHFDAFAAFEQALAHFPDHPEAIIGISNLLMDIYEEKLPAEPPKPLLTPSTTGSASTLSSPATTPAPPPIRSDTKTPNPALLNRLAARDRAYMLLSALTRLGSGWNDSQAWFTLARAQELSGEVEKAKSALWWCVELEEARPMRAWRIAVGGFTL